MIDVRGASGNERATHWAEQGPTRKAVAWAAVASKLSSSEDDRFGGDPSLEAPTFNVYRDMESVQPLYLCIQRTSLCQGHRGRARLDFPQTAV